MAQSSGILARASAVPLGRLFVRSAKASQLSVAEAKNSPGSASETSTYLKLDRTHAFIKPADANISCRAYDTGMGQVMLSIPDADTASTTDIPSTPSACTTSG